MAMSTLDSSQPISGSGNYLPTRNIFRASHSSSTSNISNELNANAGSKNVLVLGGSYGGMHAASVLAQRLPPSHRVILIERNSHFNHLYVFPRFSTLPGHEHKAFIPYKSIFKDAPKRSSKKIKTLDDNKGRDRTQRGESTRTLFPRHAHAEQDTLGMGALKEDGHEAHSHDSSTGGSSYAASSGGSGRLGHSCSDSRTSSESGYERESVLSNQTAATSLSSSYSENASRSQNVDLKQKQQMAGKHAGNRAVEDGIVAEAISGISREEEELGRPEMQVENLEGALQKGLDLEEEINGDDEEIADDFQDAAAHVVLQATVTSITPSHVVVQSNEAAADRGKQGSKKKLWSIDSVSIPYSHMIYALGSFLPHPLRTEARSKKDGISWMQEIQNRLKISNEIVLVGGGALGVEYATDIKSVYPDKKVTLIHSRKQLLPNFDEKVHEVALQRLLELGVEVVLGERLALMEGCPRGSTVTDEPIAKQPAVCMPGDAKGEGYQAHKEGICVGNGRKRVKTTGGKEFDCDLLLLCTGQQPNSSLMAQLSPTSVDSRSRLVRVLRTLQVQVPNDKDGNAPMPFDPTPPCGDCDCFLNKKAEGVDGETDSSTEELIHDCLSNVYAIGDVADAFGALNAGYQAWNMADVAAENIIRDIELQEKGVASKEERHIELKHYAPVGNMLKLSLGLGKMAFQGLPEEGGNGRPVVEIRDDPDDLAVEGVWQFMAGMSTDDMYI